LVDKGYFTSREKAKSAIMAGVVFVEGVREDKPGTKFDTDCSIVIKENTNPYVSRGGLKLEKALKEFGITLNGLVAIDIGASTGGFTDCMLKNGVKKVFCVDVGYGQLSWELRNDSRIINMERTNARFLKPEDIGVLCDFASIDVSFISLKKILPAVKNLLNINGEIVALIKPQFEAGRDNVGKKGVVREKKVHIDVVSEICNFVIESGMYVCGLTYSPVKGPEGNIEYLAYIQKNGSERKIVDPQDSSNAQNIKGLQDSTGSQNINRLQDSTNAQNINDLQDIIVTLVNNAHMELD
jgi:23S rRNA (cytidine1920-2'-O)/16S rRNA (cytidine1409-2'-O)-methyltransferase